MPEEQILKVWGELACFTRPELKVERFSYPVITPSAARGIFDAIYCKPEEFRWQVTRVEVLKPVRYIALRRNEVKDKAPPPRTILQWITSQEPQPIWADGDRDMLGTDQKGRTQRQTMALKDVAYYLYARLCPWPGFEDRLPALEAQFRRRASQGKCIYQPYFGCREFPAYFALVEEGAQLEPPFDWSLDIGFMLYDVFDLSKPGKPVDTEHGNLPSISLFKAKVEKGVLRIPTYESDEVLKGRRNGNV
jgi:CRISPR-associated protein Cas5d